MSIETVYLLSPEIVLIGMAVAIYVFGAAGAGRSTVPWKGLATIALAAAGALLFLPRGDGLLGPIQADPLAQFARSFSVIAGLLLLWMAARPGAVGGDTEYIGSLLLCVAGLMLTALAADLVLLFVALELISIPTYVLLYAGRHGPAAREATAKYFFLSILASAVFLYGLSFLYGVTGATDLAAIGDHVAAAGAAGPMGALTKIALVLIFAGLGFRIAAVPFHFYAPDVYQGTSNGNAALLSVIPKAAGLIVLVRLAVVAMGNLEPFGWHVAMALALATMTLGNVVALWQENIRRLLAYSSIAHAGYLLIGLAVALTGGGAAPGWDGIQAMLFYLCVYGLATIGAFAAVTYLGRRDRQVETVSALAGLARSRPLVAAVLALCMFSLAGIPPLAGFWGKLLIFGSALSVHNGPFWAGSRQPWFIGLAVAGVLNSAIAAAYYLRVVATMYFRDPAEPLPAEGGRGSWLVAVACAVLIVVLGVYGRPLVHWSTDASPTASAGMARPAAPAGLKLD